MFHFAEYNILLAALCYFSQDPLMDRQVSCRKFFGEIMFINRFIRTEIQAVDGRRPVRVEETFRAYLTALRSKTHTHFIQ